MLCHHYCLVQPAWAPITIERRVQLPASALRFDLRNPFFKLFGVIACSWTRTIPRDPSACQLSELTGPSRRQISQVSIPQQEPWARVFEVAAALAGQEKDILGLASGAVF